MKNEDTFSPLFLLQKQANFIDKTRFSLTFRQLWCILDIENGGQIEKGTREMATTVDRIQARKLHKYFRKFEQARWFQNDYLSLNLQDRSCEEMHRVAGIWTPPTLVSFFVFNPEGETSQYKWQFRKVDQLKNLYVWKK